MFEWFSRRRSAKEIMDEAQEMYNVPHNHAWSVPVESSTNGDWTVGKDDEGRVVLKISSWPNAMSLSLPKKEAQLLVRMINAALEE